MASDIKVQHITDTVSADGETFTLTDAVGSLDSAFIINLATRCTGTSVGTGLTAVDDLSVQIRLTGTSTVTYDRPSTTPGTDISVSYAVVEYTGAGGGANEFIVRSRDDVDMTNVSSNTATLSNTPSSIDDCIPFITGMLSADTGNGGDSAAMLAYLSGSNTLNVECASSDTNTRSAHVTTVEFTGSAWSVGHGRVDNQTADTGTISLVTAAAGTGGSTFNVSAWAEAWICAAGHTTDEDSCEDLWPELVNGTATDEVDWEFNSSHTSSADDMLVHVLNHADMAVTRYDSGWGSGPLTQATDITSASLTSTATALAHAWGSNAGATAYARGWRIQVLVSTTSTESRTGRNGSAGGISVQVVDFEAVASAGGGGILPTRPSPALSHLLTR